MNTTDEDLRALRIIGESIGGALQDILGQTAQANATLKMLHESIYEREQWRHWAAYCIGLPLGPQAYEDRWLREELRRVCAMEKGDII